MGRDLGIADRLRKRGLNVVEVAGWQSRGSDSFNPRGSVDHHTAGPKLGNSPSLGICIRGRSDLPGPLCNVFIARDNTCYVVASGKANHAGTGSWHGLSGNSSVFGIERENIGTPQEPWRPDQTLVAAAAHAALIEGRADASQVCRHAEWTSRKVDTHTLKGEDLRHLVNLILASTPQPAPAPVPAQPDYAALRRLIAGTLLPSVQSLPNLNGSSSPSLRIVVLQRALNLVTGAGLNENGTYDKATIDAVVNFQNFINLNRPGSITDFPGAAHETTRWWLATSLANIRDGK